MNGQFERQITRRTLLRGALTGVAGTGAFILVGCGDDAAPTPTATRTGPAITPPPQATASPAATSAASLIWRKLDITGPTARRDHSMTLNPEDGRIYLFGGRARGVASNDLWIFDPNASSWSLVATSGASPAERFGHNAFYDRVNKRLVIALGQQDGSTFFDDVWAFDPATSAWTDIGGTSSNKPEVRYGAGGAHDEAENRILISHGFTDRGRFDDTWIFDLASNRWITIATDGAVPVKRCLTRCLWQPSNQQMLLYGGQTDDTPFLGDQWSLDTTDGAWAEQKPALNPGARNLFGATLNATGDRWYIFGGNTPDGPSADSWTYDLAASAWSKLEASSPPPARYSADAAIAGNSLFVFGGHNGSAEVGDTWALDLA